MPQAAKKAEESSTEAVEQDANVAAESSDAEPGKDANTGGKAESKEDLLSVLQDVAAVEDEGEPTGEPSTPESEGEEDASEDDDTDEDDADGGGGEDEVEGSADSEAGSEDDDGRKPPPFHDHPRWKELVTERDRLKEPAENYNRIEQFMEANGLTPDEAAEGFQVMALMKNDPVTARQYLEQKLQSLRAFDPNYIPPDLAQEVQDGTISEQRAQELAQARAQANQSQMQAQRFQQQHQTAQQQAQQQQQVHQSMALANAVNAWESEIKSKDVDYAKKAPWVQDRLRALMVERGKPDTANKAVAMAEEAYDEVNKRLKQTTRQRKRESKPTPSSGATSSTKAEPKSVHEAVQQAVGRG